MIGHQIPGPGRFSRKRGITKHRAKTFAADFRELRPAHSEVCLFHAKLGSGLLIPDQSLYGHNRST